jgi:hypothetical protein
MNGLPTSHDVGAVALDAANVRLHLIGLTAAQVRILDREVTAGPLGREILDPEELAVVSALWGKPGRRGWNGRGSQSYPPQAD